MRAPAEGVAGGTVMVEWTGPDNTNDYLTIVAKAANDGAPYRTTFTSQGYPAKLEVPKEAGAAEVRYMSGQGHVVLARAPITVK